MAGYPDQQKRAMVKKVLKTKAGQEASDRAVAKQLKVSKVLVTTVRREMIASGEHPRGRRLVQHAYVEKGDGGAVEYRPGAVARGGYVYGPGGKIIPKEEWEEIQGKRKRGK